MTDSHSAQFLPDLDELEDKAICHSLEGFSFSKDAFSFDQTNFFRNAPSYEQDDEDENEPAGFNDGADIPMDMDGFGAEGPAVEDFFVGDQAVNDDYVNDDPASPSVGSEGGMADEAREHGGGGGAFAPFDARKAPNERDLVMAMTDAEGGGMMMDYFDRGMLKNWAGPEHWKLRKVVRKREPFITFGWTLIDTFRSGDC